MLINQSRLEEWQKCPRRYAWRYLLNLEPPTPSLRLHVGTAVHAGLAAFYRTLRNTEAAISAYRASMAEFSVSDVNRADYEVALPLWETRLAFYGKHHEREDFRVRLVPEKELQVSVGRHQVAVRVDLVIERPDGSVWVMDHKTADRTGASYWPRFFVDLQGTSYLYAVQKAIGVEVIGWIINVIKSTKEGWYEREAFTRSADQIRSWENQVSAQLDHLEGLRATEDPEELDRDFPQFTHECHSWGRTCAYLGMCQAGLRAGRAALVGRRPDYVDDAVNRGGAGDRGAGAPQLAGEAKG